MNIKAVKSDVLSKYDERYVIIDLDTGEILDDCQGYGYKTKQKAHLAYAYKNRDKSKDYEKRVKRNHIKKWLSLHKDFRKDLEINEMEFIRNGEGKINAKLIREILKQNHLEIDFQVRDLLNVLRYH